MDKKKRNPSVGSADVQQERGSMPRHEPLVAGFAGAFLFSLAGGIVYFFLFPLGTAAGLCGAGIFSAAYFGCRLFSGKKRSTFGVVIAAVLLVAISLLSAYFALSYSLYKAYRQEGVRFFDAVQLTPILLQDAAVRAAAFRSVLFAWLSGAASAILILCCTARKNGGA